VNTKVRLLKQKIKDSHSGIPEKIGKDIGKKAFSKLLSPLGKALQMPEKHSRERLESRLGFILISAGCAIGIGNVWKFPYLAGQNGGGIFVLIYLFFLAVLGIPVMTMEFSMGRASRKSPIHLYQRIAPCGSKWNLHGIVCMAGNYILMMFYTTVAGWMIKYFVSMARGDFEGLDKDGATGLFGGMLSSPSIQVGYMAVVVIVGFFINSLGLQKGLEKVSKWMMSSLLIIMVILFKIGAERFFRKHTRRVKKRLLCKQ